MIVEVDDDEPGASTSCGIARSRWRQSSPYRSGQRSTGFARPPPFATRWHTEADWGAARDFWSFWAIESAVARCLTPGLFAFESLAIVPFPTISFSKPFQSRAEHGLQARAPWPYPWSSFPNPERCSTERTGDHHRGDRRPGPLARARRYTTASRSAQPDRLFLGTHEHAAIRTSPSLAAPEPGATVIRRLRGKVAVIAVTRSFEPIVVPLKGDDGVVRSVSSREMTMVVAKVSLAPGAPASLTVTIHNRDGLASGATPDPDRPNYAAFNRDRLLEHLELYDSAGRRIEPYPEPANTRRRRQWILRSLRADGDTSRPGPSCSNQKNARNRIPSELRYYPFIQKAIDIPFDFSDVPLP